MKKNGSINWNEQASQDQEKNYCKYCHEPDGLHETNCPCLIYYFKGFDAATRRSGTFFDRWTASFLNSLAFCFIALIALSGIILPGIAIDYGLVTTLAGKVAMVGIMVITTVLGVTGMVSYFQEDPDKPQKWSSYY